jgi:hypothetical protein
MLKIDPSKMEAIMKWSFPTNCIEVKRFVGKTQYLWKFIASFSVVAALLHAITTCNKSFQWGKIQQNAFDDLEINIIQAPVLMLPNLKKPFKVETYASGYAMGEFLMQGGRILIYNFEVFHGVVLKSPTYENDLYAFVQDVKKWKHYLMGKETIIHIDHQLL